MKICTIRDLLDAKVVAGEENLGKHVYSACGSDMMSDVLAYVKDQAVLLTGLVNTQVIRPAELMDMVRNKKDESRQPEVITIPVQVVLDGKVVGEASAKYNRNKARAYG